ncbi:MAG: hypothetical protein A3I73_03665 [Omnitrophica bacterium RIFCSPLOWO2_02_FULL_45_16]|nr:MAG: hypothetical protein A3C51_05825 [Omnitrophica bacterium RIFCSPHIGHO2_02_FULL_46_20]OGW92904.1 MAG: hypothetical protein A3G36_03490 [Omnitrophica bacterium RIFCSPLOWO2_12_FULL_45_13]OGX01353.1 MAG: hypothetical protein A3I73_03665 [Omnitrophica bacterium RIFCSPLOWO2_02_FULL_45_16]
MRTINKLWLFIAVLIILTPIGLILPAHFKSGAAWGEWGLDELRKLIGYMPEGIEKFSRLWSAPIPNYGSSGISYIISAALGIFIVITSVFLIGKFLSRKE